MNLLLLEREGFGYSLMQSHMERLKAAFERNGVSAETLKAPSSFEKAEMVLADALKKKRYDAAIGIEDEIFKSAKTEDRFVFDEFHVPLFNWELDHPFERYMDYRDHPAGYHVFCVDKNHCDLVQEIYPAVQSASFIPLPGFESDTGKEGTEEEYADREMDVILTASCFGTGRSDEDIGKYLDGVPEGTQLFIRLWSKLILENRNLPAEAVLKALLESGEFSIGTDYPAFASSLGEFGRLVVMHTRSRVREELVRHLMKTDIRIDLFGDGWDDLIKDSDNPNLTLHRSISHSETGMLYQNGKILLNTMPWFKNGCHDRICTGLLNHIAVLTDTSRYLEEVYDFSPDKRELWKYDISHTEETADFIREMLKIPDELFLSAQRGNEKTRHWLSWDMAAETMIKIIESINR